MTDKNKIKRTKKAFKLACKRLANITTICPTERHQANQDCLGVCTKCWELYFYDLVDGKGE